MIFMSQLSVETQDILKEMRVLAASNNSDWQTLPPAAYHSREIFELEKERIFNAGWVMIGREDNVANPGDYMSVDVLDEPLVMTRDRQGELHVLSRVCRHRWMKVCEGKGNSHTLTCPYHLWSYHLNGKLRGAPEMDKTPGFGRSSIELPHIRHEVWQGFVFVNIDGNAQPLSETLPPLEELIREFDLGSWVTVKTVDWGECPWDWKVFQDNGDCYHHLGIHQNSLQLMWPADKSWDAANNGHFSLVYSEFDPDYMTTGEDGKPIVKTAADMPHALGLTDIQRRNLLLVYIFPNYFIAPQPDITQYARVFPLGPGRIRLYTDILVRPEIAEREDIDDIVGRLEELFNQIHAEEDAVACTSVQQGLQSRFAIKGKFSHLERHNRDFALWVSRKLTGT